MKKLITICAVVFLMSSASWAGGVLVSDQGFETDTAGWTEYGGTITRVATGTHSVDSAVGSYHAELSLPYDEGGMYTFGSHEDRVLPWPGFETFYQRIDMYLDPAAGNVGDSFDVYTTVYGVNTGGYISNEGFNVEKTAAGVWQIKAINDAVENALSVTSSQWLTLESNWNEEANGMARDSYIYNASGTQIYSLDRPTKALNTTETYKTGYFWLMATSGDSVVAVDNAQYVVPEPATVCLLGFGALSLIRRRRKA
jgi:hypothetical protein